MKRSISRWTMAATAAALLAVPATGAAQTSGTSTPQTQSSTSSPSSASQQDVPEAAREHLRQAKSALDQVNTTNLNAKARPQVTELKKRMTALERAVGVNDNASATGQANRNTRATANRGNVNWGTEVAAIDKALTTLLGPAATTGATGTTTPPATGTSGAAGAAGASGGMTLDETTRTKLTEIRTHITAFATAMAGGQASTEPTSSAAAGTSGTAASGTATSGTATSGTATSGTTGSTTGSTSGTAGTTTQQPPTDPQAQTPATTTPQVDENAARQHLTEARNTLSAMTQLPAASQLQGEARTHVTQLISNFNELITTQNDWRATYAKLETNMTALLGPDPEEAGAAAGAAAGTTGVTGTTGTTGSTVATAGTSGATAVELDPTVREKLVELRRHLNAFEKAAGGGAAASATASSPATADPMTSGSAAASGTTGSTSSATSGTTGATGTASGTAGTTGTATSSADPAQSGAQTAQAGNADLMRHVAAIEAMLRMQDDSGGLTLTKAQVEELRTHWAALRAAIERR